jgi:hypothetical protein
MKYIGINALIEIFKNKKFFDSIVLLVNETGTLIKDLKGIKIQALFQNSYKEVKITDNDGSTDIVIDCGDL